MAQPIITVRRGGLSVAVWENRDAEGRVNYSSQLQKRYKDKASGQWKDSQYLFESDLLEAAELLRAAWHKIRQKRDNAPKQAPPETPAATGTDQIPF